jgi:RsiW-degrading membrane proteinase PrsW (M82 family)
MQRTAGDLEVRPRTFTAGRILLGGLALWVATIVVTLLTNNVTLVPTIVLLGSFLVPVSFVSLAFERWRDEHVTTELIITAFFVGGIFGVLGASVLESYLLHPSTWLFLGVGLIEEAVKLWALVLVTRRMQRRHARDGMVLGAAVGFGFAAFESAGYAFVSMLTVRGLDLRAMVETEVLRGLITPVGHGLWTAILGGVLFSQSRDDLVRYTKAVLGAYLWVSLLHAFWDSMRDIAVNLTFVLTATPTQERLLQLGYIPDPTSQQAHLFTVFSVGGLTLVSVLGILTLIDQARRASHEDHERTTGRRARVKGYVA